MERELTIDEDEVLVLDEVDEDDPVLEAVGNGVELVLPGMVDAAVSSLKTPKPPKAPNTAANITTSNIMPTTPQSVMDFLLYQRTATSVACFSDSAPPRMF